MQNIAAQLEQSQWPQRRERDVGLPPHLYTALNISCIEVFYIVIDHKVYTLTAAGQMCARVIHSHIFKQSRNHPLQSSNSPFT